MNPPDSAVPNELRARLAILMAYASRIVSRGGTILLAGWFLIGLWFKPIGISLYSLMFFYFVIWTAARVLFTPFYVHLTKGAREMTGLPRLKPYRFGVVLGLVMVASAIRFGWLAAYWAIDDEAALLIALSALTNLALGLGILRRLGFTFPLLVVYLMLTVYHPLLDWWRMSAMSIAYTLVPSGFIVACVATAVYFFKRREEFTFRWKFPFAVVS